ncbi:MAG: hypothetical protein ISP48_02585 [Candidatus Puniceispirillum sp.]|nr:hypothetical protein [Candidatus Puniceispirillum sp.]
MSNSDLLIAQLQRRNRIIFGSMIGGIAVLALVLGFFLLTIPTNTPPVPASNSDSSDTEASDTKSAATNPPDNADLPPTVEASPEDKQNFLAAVEIFNTDIKAKMAAYPALAATPAYLDLISQLEADMVSLTGQNRYKDATSLLANTAMTVNSWMAAELDKFQQLIGDADTAWQNKTLTQLAGILARASAIYTGHPAPLDHYRGLAADWPAVSAALQRANKAQVENKPADELKALQEIATLRHDIAGLNDRITAVGQRLHQQRVDQLLNQIAQALTKGDAGVAGKALRQLRSLDPQTPEIPKLQADLAQLEEDIAFAVAMRAMDQFAAADKWAEAYEVAAANQKQFQNYEKFQQRANFVGRVHNLISSSAKMLAAPDLLIRSSTQKLAAELIADAATTQSFSPTLTRQRAALEAMLQDYTTPLEIIVLSDTHTFVEVKSVGQVGSVAEKTIQLLPGDYVFEGKRKGFVTIRVPVALRPGDSGKRISVIADEQI